MTELERELNATSALMVAHLNKLQRLDRKLQAIERRMVKLEEMWEAWLKQR